MQPPSRIPRLLLSVLLCLLPTPALGQAIRGQVVDSDTGAPVDGVLVILLEGERGEADATLSNEAGRFGFRVRAGVSYTLRAERIGYETVTLLGLRPTSGETLNLRVPFAKKAIALDSLIVEGERECVVRPDEGMALAQLWEEARKVLTNQEWVANEGSRAFEILRYRRRLDRSGMIVESESREERRVVATTAIRSLPASDLMENGFVRPVEGRRDSYVYYGPDARALLSEEFLDTHCLRFAGPSEMSGTVGIEFEPVNPQGVPDIRGTLFLDPEGFQLRALEFRYTWAPDREVRGMARGRVEFQVLPDGAWVIGEWWIRLPELARGVDPGTGLRLSVTGFLVEGEEVIRAPSGRGSGRDPERGTVEGVVWDSLSGGPLAGARVYLSGTGYWAESDARGHFALAGIRTGTFRLAFSHTVMDSIQYIPPAVDVSVEPGVVTEALLAIPGSRTLWVAQCGLPQEEGRNAAVAGVVRDLYTLDPVARATVLLEWKEDRREEGRSYKGDSWTVETFTDGRGRFVACGLPPGADVTARAVLGREAGRPVPVPTSPESLTRMDLLLGGDPAPAESMQNPDCPAGPSASGTGSVTGRVSEGATGVSVGKTKVWLSREEGGEPWTVEADAHGRFLFCSLEPGPYLLRVALREVGEARAAVEVRPDRTVQQDLPLAFHGTWGTAGSIEGRVVTGEGGTPLPGVTVILNEEESVQISGEDGTFSFPKVQVGAVRLRASVMGRADTEGELVLGGGQTLRVEIRMSLQPLELDPIVVEASRLEAGDLLAEVRYRAQRGWGTVLLDDEMEVRRSAMRTTDILQEHGATVLTNGRGLFFRRTGCGPVVYIDGVKVTSAPRSGIGGGVTEAAEAVNRISPYWIRAMEIYRGPAQVPGEFLDSNARCGVILIWTRRGGDPDRGGTEETFPRSPGSWRS